MWKAPRTGYTGDTMIPFNAPPVVGTELDYMQSAMNSGKLCGDGGFTRRCQQWFEQRFGTAKALLTAFLTGRAFRFTAWSISTAPAAHSPAACTTR